VLVVDDQALMRDGLVALLSLEWGITCTPRKAFAFGAALTGLVERMRTDGCEITVHTEGNEAAFAPETLTTATSFWTWP
jgi:hypothetical protein